MDISPQAVIALRMERQHLAEPANEKAYRELYRDLQPGQSVYWNGFGQPPTLSYRAAFDDLTYNRQRQQNHELVKIRTAGTVGWIEPADLELYAALYRKPVKPDRITHQIRVCIEQQGPMNIQQLKEETGLLVKEITPALHRLQESFCVYEDQSDGNWDRGWVRFTEQFPEADLDRYTRMDALKIVLRRFAYRQVRFDSAMARSFYKLPEKEIRTALDAMTAEGILTGSDGYYLLRADAERLARGTSEMIRSVYAIHRNDFLYKCNEALLKRRFGPLYQTLPYDHEPLYYLLIDGEMHGVVIGHFRNGPNDLNDIVCDLDVSARKTEILAAVRRISGGRVPARFMGVKQT